MRENLLNRITVNPAMRSGKPCIRGMRITVYDILSYMADGMSEQEILLEFPELEQDDFLACFAYAAQADNIKVIAA